MDEYLGIDYGLMYWCEEFLLHALLKESCESVSRRRRKWLRLQTRTQRKATDDEVLSTGGIGLAGEAR